MTPYPFRPAETELSRITWLMTDIHDDPTEPIEDYTDPLPDEPPQADVPQRDESPKTDEVPS